MNTLSNTSFAKNQNSVKQTFQINPSLVLQCNLSGFRVLSIVLLILNGYGSYAVKRLHYGVRRFFSAIFFFFSYINKVRTFFRST